MSRTVSWLPRLHEIRRSVANSVRSHYGRRELEVLFEIQPRTAGKMLEMLDTIGINNSRLVAKEALASFLERVRASDDVMQLYKSIRDEKADRSRARARSLVPRDIPEVQIASLPSAIKLSTGHLQIAFASIEELVESLWYLAGVLQDDPIEFAQAYEPARPAINAEHVAEARAIRDWLDRNPVPQTEKPPRPMTGEAANALLKGSVA